MLAAATGTGPVLAGSVDHEGHDEALHELGAEARSVVAGIGAGGSAEPDVDVEYVLDCRYRGQSHELSVASIEEFHGEHERRNGYARPDAPVEVVALRARARRPAPLNPEDLPVVERERREGPAVAGETDCTVWIPQGWTAEPGPTGAWIITRSEDR